MGQTDETSLMEGCDEHAGSYTDRFVDVVMVFNRAIGENSVFLGKNNDQIRSILEVSFLFIGPERF